jgi:hypothetical protein
LFELLSEILSDLGSFIDNGEDSAHGFLEFHESEFACVFVIIFLLNDFISKENVLLPDTDVP